jgi:hypothetical protein
MAVTAELLADWQAASSETTAYTVPASTWIYSGRLYAYNTHTADEVLKVYLHRSGGTSRLVSQHTLAANGGWVVVDGIDLGPADLLRLSSTSATEVNYVFSGRKRS